MAVKKMFEDMSPEDALSLWRFGGFGDEYDFPGVSAALFRMVRGVTPAAQRRLMQDLSLLANRRGALAALALLRLVLPLAPVPAVRHSRTECRRMLPQAGHGAIAPVRGSPTQVGGA